MLHIIAASGIGGVQVAAESVRSRNSGIHFEVEEFEKGRQLFGLVQRLRKSKPSDFPDLVVFSLWKSAFAMIIFRISFPRTYLVFFIHSSKDKHLADFAMTRLGVLLSREVWLDSPASRDNRLGRVLPTKKPVRVVSGRSNFPVPLEATGLRESFIFWGRLSEEKNLKLSLELLCFLRDRGMAPDFKIIGPDGGARYQLEALVKQLGLEERVSFLGAMPQEEIRTIASGSCFYLQTSSREGFAQSVVEAMSLGLVPVVTPAGEISNYCIDGENAVIISDIASAGETVLHLLKNKAKFFKLRKSAIGSAQRLPTYSNEFISAAKHALLQSHGSS